MKMVKLFETTLMPPAVWELARSVLEFDECEVVVYNIGYYVADVSDGSGVEADVASHQSLDRWLIEQGVEFGECVIISHGNWAERWEEFDPGAMKKWNRLIGGL